MAAGVAAGVAGPVAAAAAADEPVPRLRAAGARAVARADPVVVVRAGRPGRRRGAGRQSGDLLGRWRNRIDLISRCGKLRATDSWVTEPCWPREWGCQGSLHFACL